MAHTYICGPLSPCRGQNPDPDDPHRSHCWHQTTARRMAWVYGDDVKALDGAMQRMRDEARRWNDGAPRQAVA